MEEEIRKGKASTLKEGRRKKEKQVPAARKVYSLY